MMTFPLLVHPSVVAASGVSFTDDFNRSNENLEASANWTRIDGTAGALAIVSNRLSSSIINTNYRPADAVGIGTGDQYSQVTFVSTPGGGRGCVFVRFTDANNHVHVRPAGGLPAGGYRLVKLIAGVETAIGSDFGSPTANDIIRVEIVGQDIEVFRNGSSVHTGSLGGGELTSGYVGIGTIGGGALGFTFDDYAGGDL